MRSLFCRLPSIREFAAELFKPCFYGAYTAVCLLLYAALVAFFVLVGGTLGVVIGSLLGLRCESSRLLHRAAIGTVIGILSSVELLKISVALFFPEGKRFCVLGSLFDSATARVAKKLVRECYNPAVAAANDASTANITASVKLVESQNYSDKGILNTRIARIGTIDSSGSRVCCPICLEDFEFRHVARKLPCCHHSFHQPCINKWLRLRDSCPLCRCTAISKKLNRV
ncbi:hypothetical protein SAY86_028321 [Trapa natans]|uniref:RING-type domain-containing protein n=1 Tax=Trapa natans TaxID=22666 RepID=A0AAN7RC37_TRANT|nr:hypothetical protein SAY86_028321 [Trapa natans]